MSTDDVFEPLNKSGCDARFGELGGRSLREIAAAIRDIDEDLDAAAGPERVFDGAVGVKPQFAIVPVASSARPELEGV